jgi:hypothetical protein
MLPLTMVRGAAALMAPAAYHGTATGEDAETRRRHRLARVRETRRILVDFRQAQRDRYRLKTAKGA